MPAGLAAPAASRRRGGEVDLFKRWRLFLAKNQKSWYKGRGRRSFRNARPEKEQEKNFLAGESRQPVEWAQSAEGIPRKSKPFFLDFL